MRHEMFNRFYRPEYIVLFALCTIFYVAMDYYSSSVLDGAKNMMVIRDVMRLRIIFSVGFAILLGFMGFKITGHVWPAALVHGLVVACMLVIDLSLNELLADWMLALWLIAIPASITALSGGLALGYYWIRSKRF